MDTTSPTESLSFDLDALRGLTGSVATREFEQSSAARQPGLYAWAQTLPGLEDREFIKEAAFAIWESANMNRFRGMDHVHFKASACSYESERRAALAHPDEDCHATTLYGLAYNSAVRDAGHGHMASEVQPCTCDSTDTTTPKGNN